jgi:cyanate permease
VIAHQGGWDEMLLVLAPMAVVAALLWIAKRRVDRAASRRERQVEQSQ